MSTVTGQPHYQRIADDLRARILDGTYPPGSSLPSAKKLMDSYGVSSTVIREATGALRAEGVVKGQPGKAVYVLREPDGVGEPSEADLARTVADLVETVRLLSERVTVLEGARPPKR
ncbi:winged helix-turn-helix domain-containing protein [Longispora sp. NPDC051575]|uniref:winged helix-turn-helix domain-containing protein n=1 Tax=Longispora sp. NPDC051575 TaxID=3154943 RepID=UPI00341A44BD